MKTLIFAILATLSIATAASNTTWVVGDPCDDEVREYLHANMIYADEKDFRRITD